MNAFDTLAFVERLEAAGTDPKLSRSIAHAMHDIAMANVATKADIENAVHSLTLRMYGGLATVAGLILAAFALF